ncbi:response regulator [Lentzea alba]|uniref:response regulator n=1 Tax=Lentzea alba TaxID=2714351 RepID=UPI0039BEEF03
MATRAAELDGQDRAVPEASTLVSNMNVSQLEKVLVGALSLVLAQDKEPSGLDISQAAGRVLRAGVAVGLLEGDDWKRHILWVDDHPDNNRHERTAFESFDIEFTLATSTSQAMALLSHRRYGAIISDMGRAEGPEEGFALLNQLRANDQATPFFLYTGPAAREYQLEAAARGAQGVTADPSELVDMVTKALR